MFCGSLFRSQKFKIGRSKNLCRQSCYKIENPGIASLVFYGKPVAVIVPEQGRHYARPIDLPLSQRNVESPAPPFFICQFAAEIF